MLKYKILSVEKLATKPGLKYSSNIFYKFISVILLNRISTIFRILVDISKCFQANISKAFSIELLLCLSPKRKQLLLVRCSLSSFQESF